MTGIKEIFLFYLRQFIIIIIILPLKNGGEVNSNSVICHALPYAQERMIGKLLIFSIIS